MLDVCFYAFPQAEMDGGGGGAEHVLTHSRKQKWMVEVGVQNMLFRLCNW